MKTKVVIRESWIAEFVSFQGPTSRTIRTANGAGLNQMLLRSGHFLCSGLHSGTASATDCQHGCATQGKMFLGHQPKVPGAVLLGRSCFLSVGKGFRVAGCRTGVPCNLVYCMYIVIYIYK